MLAQNGIAVIGTGYVGLVTAACFANWGFKVHAVDRDAAKIAALNQGMIPIHEQDLAPLVDLGKQQKRLLFSTDTAGMLGMVDTVFIAVGTPAQAETGEADLSHLHAVAMALAPLLSTHRYLVIKSTVPVGTSRRFAGWLREQNPDAQFTMVSNPEFLREGMAVFDFLNPDRILLGVETPEAAAHMTKLYAKLAEKSTPLLFTDVLSAELIKYAANGFLAAKLAFVNEMASLCDAWGANIEQVVAGMGMDKRIGPGYLQPGPGFGGSCFPKDTLALQNMGTAVGMPLPLVEGITVSNARHKQRVVDKIAAILGNNLQGKTIAVWGLAFKAGTDDMRESAAVFVIEALLRAGVKIVAVDPVIATEKFEMAVSCEASAQSADAIVILTEWDLFKTVDWTKLKESRGQENFISVIDFRNLYDPAAMANLGIDYFSLGRPP
jgi:UDPglucose 6-dehydrogenase